MNDKKHLKNWMKILELSDSQLKTINDYITQVARTSGLTTKEVEDAFDNKAPAVPKTKVDKLGMWKENISLKLKLKAAQKRIKELEEKLREE